MKWNVSVTEYNSGLSLKYEYILDWIWIYLKYEYITEYVLY